VSKKIKEITAQATETHDQQRRVNDYFRSDAPHRDAIYKSADLSSRIFQLRHATILEMIKHISLPKDAPALEVGCGPGITTVEMARLGYGVHAVDTVRQMLDLTHHHAVEARVSHRITPSIGDICNLQFAENTFDLVLAVGVIQWLSAPRRAVRELIRVAKPGSHIIVTFVNFWRLFHILDPLRNPALVPIRTIAKRVFVASGLYNRDRRRANQAPRMNLYPIKPFESLVTSQGLELVKMVSVGFGPFTFFGKRILSDARDVRLHERLQLLSDRYVPILHLAGEDCILLTKKPWPQ
jgi:ubiquinone/menaquinone biosynthesis C-methylase UbiE